MTVIGTLAKANAAVLGTWGFAFHDLVQPLPEETVIVKPVVSAFAGSSLDLMLRAQGIDSLAMSGYATNFVVEGTARDAADRGYRVIILEDACVAGNPERHKAAIRNLHLVGTVTDCAVFGAAVGR
jgi:nicotinamidase-related amidase